MIPTSDTSFAVPHLNATAAITSADSLTRVLLLDLDGAQLRAERRTSQP
jgi:hypothetical protein